MAARSAEGIAAGVSIPVGNRFSICTDKFGKRGTFCRFMNSGVQLVAQSAVDRKPEGSFPGVLKIEVVGLPPNSGLAGRTLA